MSILLAAAASTLVFCAPGYPGAAGDAQPYVDEFAKTAATAAGWPAGSLTAVYDPTEQGGLAKLNQADAVLAFVPYPFYVEHAAQLHLSPLAQADVVGVGTKEKWTLVTKTGRVTGAPSLVGYTIVSVAGYSPNFVLHSALSAWQVPAGVKVEPVGQILSALRRVASGDQVAALLDQTQASALPTLPFAGDLKAVVQSPDAARCHHRGGRQPAARRTRQGVSGGVAEVGEGGRGGSGGAEGADSLGALKLAGFVMPALPADAPQPGEGKAPATKPSGGKAPAAKPGERQGAGRESTGVG